MAKLTLAQRAALTVMSSRQFASGEFYRKNFGIHPGTIVRLEAARFIETNGNPHNDKVVDLHWRITDAGRAALEASR